MRLRHIALGLAVAFALASGTAALYYQNQIHAHGQLAVAKLVYISPNSSTRAIADTLEKEGVVSQGWLFALASKLQSSHGSLKAGEYQFTAGTSLQEALSLLQSGKTYQRKLTLAEGLTSHEIVELLNKAEAMSGTVETVPPEGSLLPETYVYSYGDSRPALLERMKASMKTTLESLWNTRASDIPLTSQQQAVTLASVVEKETGLAEERPHIAGVFYNRLRTGMPLQSDPTVIYAVTLGKSKLERPISRADLNIESPYNTYKVQGLPPAPIANPGKAALQAVLNPAKTEDIFFVANGTGGHAFAKTLDEHTRNVAQWRTIEKKSAKP